MPNLMPRINYQDCYSIVRSLHAAHDDDSFRRFWSLYLSFPESIRDACYFSYCATFSQTPQEFWYRRGLVYVTPGNRFYIPALADFSLSGDVPF